MEPKTLKNKLEILEKSPQWELFSEIMGEMLEIHDNMETDLKNFIECCSNLASGDQVIEIVVCNESRELLNILTDYIRNNQLC